MDSHRRPAFWMLWILLIEILMLAVLVPNRWIDRVGAMEDRMLSAAMSAAQYAWIHRTANAWHRRLVHDSGLKQTVAGVFFPTEQARRRSRGLEAFGSRTWFPWLAARGAALEAVIHRLLGRIATIVTWWPLFVTIAVPSVWDGFMQWKIRQTDFSYASPLVHRYAFVAIVLIAMAVLVGLFAPVPIPPVVFPVAIMALVVAAGIFLVANLPKRI